jgi:hypothetical protein
MKDHLTIAHMTGRKDPKSDWFLFSLAAQLQDDPEPSGITVVFVDLYSPHAVWDSVEVQKILGVHRVIIAQPKPCVYQGAHRLTKEDWFAACNARNTALCLAQDGHIAYADDLSVLMPGWLAAVREATKVPNTITCGAYKKVKDMVVDNGRLVSFTEHPHGNDHRWGNGQPMAPQPCAGNWMFGCSLVAPVQAFLDINGWPEALCDGLGMEDVIAGIMLAKKGYQFRYDRRMLTYESEELHAQLPVMKRSDYGISPNDKSHAVLAMAQNGTGWHPNYFGEGGIAGLRQRVLAGEPFPIMRIPEHEFYTGKPLSEL